jgi:hypothetical protein
VWLTIAYQRQLIPSHYNQLRIRELFLYHQQLTGELKNQVWSFFSPSLADMPWSQRSEFQAGWHRTLAARKPSPDNTSTRFQYPQHGTPCLVLAFEIEIQIKLPL